MRALGLVVGLGLFCVLVSGAVNRPRDFEDVPKPGRKARFFPRLWYMFGGNNHCGHPDACPPHHCRFNDAVLHGFCCGCAHQGDRVPIRCPPDIRCPLSPRPLCDDYNFMMDCCC